MTTPLQAKHYHRARACAGCPFTRGGVRGLNVDRLREILATDRGFVCHETVGELTGSPRVERRQCAGYLAFQLRNGGLHGAPALAAALGGVDIDGLSAVGVIESEAALLAWHASHGPTEARECNPLKLCRKAARDSGHRDRGTAGLS